LLQSVPSKILMTGTVGLDVGGPPEIWTGKLERLKLLLVLLVCG
jgi:hypothetical protein